MTEQVRCDVLIVGAGAAGLFTALHLPEDAEVVVIDKGPSAHGSGRHGSAGSRGRVAFGDWHDSFGERSEQTGSSPWAQGGVAAALGPEDSPDLHAQDTIRVAAGHADSAAVAVLCSEAPECVLELAELGCEFDRDEKGDLHLAREGGQTVPRSAHHADSTGAAIMKTLRARASDRVRRIEGSLLRLAIVEGRCVGGWISSESGSVEVRSSATILATGGMGALFGSTTNPSGATGDGVVAAWEIGAGLSDLEFIQFHPTALAIGPGPQRALITEALRGAGAYVVDVDGRRFLFEHHSDGELAPRDVVARAIVSRRSWIDARHLGREALIKEFPTVLASCQAAGLDPVTELIPVTPAAHYSIGGIQTDLDGRSSIPRLYAVGECSSTGVHGANRLAGNSLAEALVFGRRAARAVAGQRTGRIKAFPEPPEIVAEVTFPRLEDAWQLLRYTCSERLGIERDASGLRAVEPALEELARIPLAADRGTAELRSGAIAARLIARSALLRNESRGVHHRSDHPAPEPAWAGTRLRLDRN